MAQRSRSSRAGLFAICFGSALGCGSSTSGTPETGGSTGSSGGANAPGGSSSSGASSTAGASNAPGGGSGPATGGGGATGGSLGSGGHPATGGSSAATGGNGGSGGRTLTGGATGFGGKAGAGGSVSTAGGATAGESSGGSGGTGGSGTPQLSAGCSKTPSALKSATPGAATPVNTISVGGASREFLVRWPSDYKSDTPYRLHIGLHGYGGNLSENGKDNFGLWSLSKNSTIFVTLAAVGGSWDATADLAYADAVLKQVEGELCIDTSRVMLEGFSMGGAMAWALTCSRPGVYRAVVGHSGGGVSPIPATCSPVAYLGSLGLTDVANNSQATQTDRFAKADGCTIETLPTAPKGGHICTPYKGCPAQFPVVWCSYDGGHGFQPTDSGQAKTWVPAEVWSFLSPL